MLEECSCLNLSKRNKHKSDIINELCKYYDYNLASGFIVSLRCCAGFSATGELFMFPFLDMHPANRPASVVGVLTGILTRG